MRICVGCAGRSGSGTNRRSPVLVPNQSTRLRSRKVEIKIADTTWREPVSFRKEREASGGVAHEFSATKRYPYIARRIFAERRRRAERAQSVGLRIMMKRSRRTLPSGQYLPDRSESP